MHLNFYLYPIIQLDQDHYIPSTFHVSLIFPLGLFGAVNAAQQLGVSSFYVRGTFSLAHQAAAHKHRPDVHLIPLAAVRSGPMRRENHGGSTAEQRRALRHLGGAYTFSIRWHGDFFSREPNEAGVQESVLHLIMSPQEIGSAYYDSAVMFHHLYLYYIQNNKHYNGIIVTNILHLC